MMKKSVRKLALLGALVATSAYATEMRTPWIVGDGPLRYTFEKLKQDKYNFNWWSAFHMKESHKAFLKHGTDTHPITALIFNKDNFKYNEIFPNSEVPMNTEFYNPFFRLLSLQPRVSYMEYGLTFGARWDYPVWKDKGRIGLRVSMPFRRIEMERDDVTDMNEDPLSYVRASRAVATMRNMPSNHDLGQYGADVQAAAAAAGNAGAAAQAAVRVGSPAFNQGVALVGNIGGGAPALAAAIAAINHNTVVQNNSQLCTAGGAGSNIVVLATDDTAAASARAQAGANLDAPLGQVIAAAIPINGGLADQAAVAAQLNTPASLAAVNQAGSRGDLRNPANQDQLVQVDWRLDYVASLPDANHRSIVNIPDANTVNLVGNQIAVAANQQHRAIFGLTRGDAVEDVVANGFVGWMAAPATKIPQSLVAVADIQPVAANLSTPSATQLGYFSQATDYTPLTDANHELTQASLDNASDLWLTFQLDGASNDENKLAVGNGGFARIATDSINQLSQYYTENPLLFFERQGYTLDDQIRSGLGDIDLDLFYEHTFNKEWMGELMLGVRFPTGGDQDKYGSPYKVMLGNGEHWEIKLGGLIAWQPIKWMNIKVDAKYSFVLEGDEHRMAAFKGAKVKNFGPRADADVDWGYFVGHVDFNFFHPKTSDIRAMMGYEFYYKTEDHVDYKQSKMQSWLGRVWDPANSVWKDNPQDLDSHLARKNTEAISHKCRGEISWQAHKYLELFAGVSSTFAGQNAFRDRDAHGGVNIRF